MAKLTLAVDEKVIRAAKEYASIKGTSVSEIVEDYLRALTTTKAAEGKAKLSSRVARLKGIIQLPEHFIYKEALSKSISQKHK